MLLQNKLERFKCSLLFLSKAEGKTPEASSIKFDNINLLRDSLILAGMPVSQPLEWSPIMLYDTILITALKSFTIMSLALTVIRKSKFERNALAY
jgi:hypothetical protein